MSHRRTQQAHEVVARYINAGDCAIDATVGNGHDTVFLAQCVGEHGQVFGFDVQLAAIDATGRRLGVHGQDPTLAPLSRVTLLTHSHADMATHIPLAHHGRVKAVMFNLGYLPGCDHAITTRAPSTLEAITVASRLIAPDGVVSVLSYPGHAAGREELQHLLALIAGKPDRLSWHEHEPRAAPDTAPRLFIATPRD